MTRKRAKVAQRGRSEKPVLPSPWVAVLAREQTQHRVSLLLLVLFPTVLLWSVLFSGKTLVPADLLLVMSPWRRFAAERFPEFDRVKAPLLDVLQQYYPWRKFYAETLRQGELPLWNPYMFCGSSFVGNGMSAIFYPLNLLFVVLPVEVAFGWVAWLHLVLIGVFLFGFLRCFVAPIPALAGAVAFQFCGFFVAWLAYLPLLTTATWLPAALWAYEATTNSGRFERLPAVLLPSFCLGMALLAGHPQIGFYVLWAFCVYWLLRTLWFVVWRNTRWREAFGVGGLSLVGGIAFGAPQLLPLIEMAQISFRSGVETKAAAVANRLPIDQFARLFVPAFFGDWRSGTHFLWDFARFNFVERTGYPGVVAFLLGMVGLIAGPFALLAAKKQVTEREQQGTSLAPSIKTADPEGLPWLSLVGAVFAVVGILAASVPTVHRFMALGLPGTQAFVGISRALFLFDLGVALLGAVGLEALMQRQLNQRLMLVSVGAGLVFMAACVSHSVNAHAATALHPLLRDFTLQQIYRWLALLTVGVLAIFVAVRLPSLNPLATAILPLIVATDMLLFAWDQHPSADRRMVFFETPSLRWLQQNLGSQRLVTVGTDALRHWTPPNTLMVYRLRDAQGSDSLMTMRIFRLLQTWDRNSPLHRAFAVRNFDSPLLDLMAVRYIVAAEPLSANERKGLRLVHDGDLWVYENEGTLPRLFLASEVRWAQTPQEALRFLRSPQFDPRQTVVLEQPFWQPSTDWEGYLAFWKRERQKALPSALPSPLEPAISGEGWQEGINHLRAVVQVPRPSALVVADGAYPGWQAFVKSRTEAIGGWEPLPVFVANYAFRAVLLTSGEKEVAWVYYPSSVAVGLFLSLSVVSIWVALWSYRWVQRLWG